MKGSPESQVNLLLESFLKAIFIMQLLEMVILYIPVL